MEQIIRIVETGYPLGGRLAHVYIFCLPPAAMSRLGEILEKMQHMAPQGVEQFAGDDAGLLIYTREGVDNTSTCLATLSVIDLVHETGLKIDPNASFFFVRHYGRWKGATTYAELQQNPHFVLPYMEATSAPSA